MRRWQGLQWGFRHPQSITQWRVKTQQNLNGPALSPLELDTVATPELWAMGPLSGSW
ncbi:MAG: hypothetical protein CM1200mP20_10130 [Pseudomonadota bacterium]|nr:MAG: hypothetical protein CM1200mP20_10130 [Pseudomonadota bacterium]